MVGMRARAQSVGGELDIKSAGGVAIEQARAEVRGIAEAMAKDHPNTNKGYGGMVATFKDWLSHPGDTFALEVILGAVGFILLIACSIGIAEPRRLAFCMFSSQAPPRPEEKFSRRSRKGNKGKGATGDWRCLDTPKFFVVNRHL